MKTAVSIPDDTFEQGERLARRLGLSRSALYARALAQLVEQHAVIDQADDPVTARINAVWAEMGADSSELDEGFKRLRNRGVAAQSESDW